MLPHMQELREISDKITQNHRILRDGTDKHDNYFLSSEIQSLKRARETIMEENPFSVIAHPDPDSLPPFQRADPEDTKEYASRIISNPDPNKIHFKKIK